MNEIIERIVRTHAPESAGKRLSFIKLNTAGSPMRGKPKVLFLCFFNEEQFPAFCLKTVRSKGHNAVITEGFGVLQQLEKIAGGKNLFPRSIWQGEDDSIAWSIESAFAGRKPVAGDTTNIVDAYFDFARASLPRKRIANGEEVAKKLIADIDCSSEDKKALEALWKEVAIPEIILLPQHGDFTPDNILVAREGVHVVDCDRFLPEGVAGFDIFYFLVRTLQTKSDVTAYLQKYCEIVGMSRSFSAGDLLLWGLQDEVVKKESNFPFSLKNFTRWYQDLRSAKLIS